MIIPRATGAGLIALSVLCCVPAGDVTFQLEARVKFVKKKKRGENREGGQSMKKAKRLVHTRIPVPGTSHGTWYCVFEIKHSAARHSTAPKGTARQHGTARRCAARC